MRKINTDKKKKITYNWISFKNMNNSNVSWTAQMLLVKWCALWVYNQKTICFIYLIFSRTIYLKMNRLTNWCMVFVCMSLHIVYVFFCKGWLDKAWVKNMINNNVIFCVHNN